MMTDIYYALAIVAYSIFLVQFLLSLFGAEYDSDINTDIDIDTDSGDNSHFGMSWSDIFSFKGVIHFLMGFAGWISLAQYTRDVVWYDYIIAIVLGFSFIFILLMVGKMLYKLRHEPEGKQPIDFLGASGTISIIVNNGLKNKDGFYSYYIILTGEEFNGQDLLVYSKSSEYELGDVVTIDEINNGKYYI